MTIGKPFFLISYNSELTQGETPPPAYKQVLEEVTQELLDNTRTSDQLYSKLRTAKWAMDASAQSNSERDSDTLSVRSGLNNVSKERDSDTSSVRSEARPSAPLADPVEGNALNNTKNNSAAKSPTTGLMHSMTAGLYSTFGNFLGTQAARIMSLPRVMYDKASTQAARITSLPVGAHDTVRDSFGQSTQTNTHSKTSSVGSYAAGSGMSEYETESESSSVVSDSASSASSYETAATEVPGMSSKEHVSQQLETQDFQANSNKGIGCLFHETGSKSSSVVSGSVSSGSSYKAATKVPSSATLNGASEETIQVQQPSTPPQGMGFRLPGALQNPTSEHLGKGVTAGK